MKENTSIGLTPKVSKPAEPIQQAPKPQEQPVNTPKTAEVDISDLKSKIMTVVSSIKDLRIANHQIATEKARLTTQLRDMESNATAVATSATGEDGKPLFTNAEKRKIHADGILAKSDAYASIGKRVDELTELLRTNEIELEYNTYIFRGMEIISRYRA